MNPDRQCDSCEAPDSMLYTWAEKLGPGDPYGDPEPFRCGHCGAPWHVDMGVVRAGLVDDAVESARTYAFHVTKAFARSVGLDEVAADQFVDWYMDGGRAMSWDTALTRWVA